MTRAATPSIRLRTIALPAEHGSWGLVLEPIVLGLLVAPSWAGLLIGLSAFGAFLVRRPAKVLWTQRRRRLDERARAAALFFVSYGVLFALPLAAVILVSGTRPLLPLVLAAPLILVFAFYDLDNQSRSTPAELAGAVVFSTVPMAIALADGWAIAPSAALMLALTARAIPSILFVRARIRLDRDRDAGTGVALASHFIAVLAAAALATADLLPALAVVAIVVLLARAVLGLSAHRPAMTIRALGFTELGLGIFTVLCIAAGYWTGT